MATVPEITALEKKHHDFYAPTYRLLVDERDLLTDERMEVEEVRVDSTLEGMDQFSVTVNGSFDVEKRRFRTPGGDDPIEKLFAFGTRVEIGMGYVTVPRHETLFLGVVTSVKTSFPSSGLPKITVSGYDLSYCMSHGRVSKTWDSRKDSQIAAAIAGKYGLEPDVQDTLVEHPRTEQNQQTDQEFLAQLADRDGFEVYTRRGTLHFRAPESDETAVVELEWGKSLVSFSPEINISEQVTRVEVRGWDVATKQPIVGKAGPGDEPGRDGGQRSGGEVVETACGGEKTTLKRRYPVRSQQEADQKARSILKRRSELFVKGSGEAIGLPEIMPGENVRLLGLGSHFSKTYFVEQATHTIGSSGYRTTFRVKETTAEAEGRG